MGGGIFFAFFCFQKIPPPPLPPAAWCYPTGAGAPDSGHGPASPGRQWRHSGSTRQFAGGGRRGAVPASLRVPQGGTWQPDGATAAFELKWRCGTVIPSPTRRAPCGSSCGLLKRRGHHDGQQNPDRAGRPFPWSMTWPKLRTVRRRQRAACQRAEPHCHCNSASGLVRQPEIASAVSPHWHARRAQYVTHWIGIQPREREEDRGTQRSETPGSPGRPRPSNLVSIKTRRPAGDTSTSALERSPRATKGARSCGG